ncbi:ABC transporter ATP-binding protein [Actinokineospora cianjurensis]|uniref:Peptide/nickel transport system ATP-binding protein n=1 Tax=Actinokineospora cianjurensis TaxID=585224 RepID=A0A421B255_9PSEU|nr:ABC transporter ATP-binding protein [Actinokineospora cianjurensis]RLK58516.1 peptide/nickel transport system ATP-binding protein [Actinokineospora cianjurensis]
MSPTTHQTTADVLSVRDLTVEFPDERGRVQAVRGVSWSLREGEVLGVVGESGCGKSATALAVMGLLPPGARMGGSVRLHEQELAGLGDKGMSSVRGRSVAMVFQDPLSSLNPVYSVGFQVAEAVRAHHPGTSRDNAVERAVRLLELVGIPNARDRVGDYPHEFSGGMRQRVVIAIAMANDPDVIIADEPTTALDVTIQAQVLDALRTARAETGAAAVIITHDLGVVAGQADRVVVMYAGKVVESGTADDVFYRPRMPYTLGLLGSLPRLDGRFGARLTPIAGTPPALDRPIRGCAFAPRCPLARERCLIEEPGLREVDGHLTACHFAEELVDKRPEDVFVPVIAPVALTTQSPVALTTQSPVALTAERPVRTDGPLLLATGLVKHYPVRGGGFFRRQVGQLHAVCDVSFSLSAGETLGLVGESGSGKSTIAKLLMSLEAPTAGRVELDGAPVRGRKHARDLQMVFQDPMGSLDPRMTAADLVAEPLRINGLARQDARARALELLASVGLGRGRSGRYPHEFSGGQRQRIGIARALALRPRVLILDEPVSALDVSVQADVINLLEDLQDALGLSYLFIAHDLSVVRHIADRVAVLYLGRVVEVGERDAVFDHPSHPYTQALISAVPLPDPRKERVRERILLSGDVPSPVDPPSGCRFRTRCPKFLGALTEVERSLCVDEVPDLVERGQGHPVACHFGGPR